MPKYEHKSITDFWRGHDFVDTLDGDDTICTRCGVSYYDDGLPLCLTKLEAAVKKQVKNAKKARNN